MDTIKIIFENISQSSAFDISSILSYIKDFCTIVAIILGIVYGRKGIKKFLIDDIVKPKIIDLHDSNRKVFEFSKDVISKLSNKEYANNAVTEQDLSEIKEITQKLVELSNGASKEVATLSFFINETIKKIPTHSHSANYSHHRVARDFYFLLYETVLKISDLSSNIIDVPKKIELEPYNEIKKQVRKYLNDKKTLKLKGIQFGLNLNANSTLSLLFVSLINKSTNEYIFHKAYYEVIQNNTPIIYRMLINKIYFPVTLGALEEEPSIEMIAGKRILHLVDFKMRKHLENGITVEKHEFYYSNIKTFVNFMGTIKADKFQSEFEDTFLDNHGIFSKLDLSISELPNETIKIVCDGKATEEYYKKIKRKFKKKIKQLSKSQL